MNDLGDQNVKKPVPITTAEFDRKVEAGEDIDDHLDWENAVMIGPDEMSPGQKLSMVEALLNELLAKEDAAALSSSETSLNISVPLRVHLKIGTEAVRRGVSREALVQSWIEERASTQEVTK